MRDYRRLFNASLGKPDYLIAGFTVFLLVLLWTAVAFQLAHDKAAVLDAARANTGNLARAYAEHVAGVLKPLDQLLLRIRNEFEKNSLTPDLAQSLRDDADTNAGAVIIAIVDERGYVVATNTQPPPNSGFAGDREYFLTHVRGDPVQLYLSEPMVGRILGKQVIVLSRRLQKPDGAFAGIVFVSLDLQYLSGFFSDLAIGKNSSFAIVGRDMIVRDMIRGSGRVADAIGTSVAKSQLVPALARAANGAYEADGVLDGVRRLFSYRTLPDYPLIVLASVAEADELADFRERKAWLVGAAAALSLIFVAVAIFQLRRLTLQSQSEQTLRQTQELLIESQHVAKLGYVVNDVPNNRMYWSDSLFKLRRVPPRAAFTFEESVEFMEPEDRERYVAARKAAIAEHRAFTVDVRVRRPDDSFYWEHRVVHPHFDANGELIRVLMVVQDITERRAIEAQLIQAQKMEAIGNLTGGMAHDFNNLLGIILGNLDLLRPMLKSNPDAEALAGEAFDACLRGADLTRRLLAFARRQALQPQSVDINQLVSDTAKLLERVLGSNIQLSLKLAAKLWPVFVDSAQLQSSLVNLATNARDAMPDGGSLLITTTDRVLDADYCDAHPGVSPGDYVMIEVTDSGTGIDAEIMSHIFEPFYTTKEPGKGTGLGLSMVFGFMKQSGGYATVYSEVGVGTTFQLFLPRDSHAEHGIAEQEKRPALPARAETILVVDDNESLRRVVMRQITQLGYRALEAKDGATALDLLEREKVDLLFTDIVMPGGLDGFGLARLAIERWPNVKVVLTSGFPGVAISNKLGSLAPLARMLNKPYSKDELARILRDALDADLEAATRV
jgi:signal transduction histidine kinase/ActR/RegA family two-component response regulator